jgi:hypothetical protein
MREVGILGDRNSEIVKLLRGGVFVCVQIQAGHGIFVFLNERCIREGVRSQFVEKTFERRVQLGPPSEAERIAGTKEFQRRSRVLPRNSYTSPCGANVVNAAVSVKVPSGNSRAAPTCLQARGPSPKRSPPEGLGPAQRSEAHVGLPIPDHAVRG